MRYSPSIMEPAETAQRQPPTREDYRLLIEREWADLHHSRVQEWTALGVVAGAHVGILQILGLSREILGPEGRPAVAIAGFSFGLVFAVFGILLTCRHRHLMIIKLGWIFQAEDRLGLVRDDTNPHGILPRSAEITQPVRWRGLAWPRFLSTSWLIIAFYFWFAVFDVGGALLFALR